MVKRLIFYTCDGYDGPIQLFLGLLLLLALSFSSFGFFVGAVNVCAIFVYMPRFFRIIERVVAVFVRVIISAHIAVQY